MQLGTHASIRRGFLNAFSEAFQLNCKTLQIFPRRPRQAVRTLSEAEIRELKEFRAKYSISPLVIHALYQPNIASSNQETLKKSRESLLQEFRFASQLEAEFFIVHAGSYSADSDLKTGIRTCARTIRDLLESLLSKTKVLIENVPGGERRIGGKFEELKWLLKEIGWKERTGICLDTAHAFAAGYAIGSIQGMEEMLALVDKELGLETVELFHMNDTLAEFSSHKDIHQHIGEGHIGQEALRWLAGNSRFQKTPAILETPKSSAQSDRINLARLRD